MMKKIIKSFSSPRFTIALICLLGGIFAIGLWVPQKDLLRDIYFEWRKNSPGLVSFLDFFQLTSIYTSWVTLTLWICFFVNLSLVLWQRIPMVKKRIELSETRIAPPETAPGYPFHATYPLPAGMDGATVLRLLAGRGYALIGNASAFYGVKNRYSPLAFALFHISFYLIMLGGLVSFYTRFTGYVDLAQGEQFNGELVQYNQYPRLPKIGSLPEASFTIKSIMPHVDHNTPTGIDVVLVDKGGNEHSVDINRPYTTGPSSFVFNHLGVAPLFVLKDATGKEIGGSYFKLDVVKGKEDTFRLRGIVFRARYYPDYTVQDGKPTTKSMEFNNPVFVVVAERDRKKIAESTITKNGSMEVAGYQLEMRDMPFWVRFYVDKQRGLPIIYAGYFIASIALIWRLIFFRREIVGAVREQEGSLFLIVAGRSEYYKNLAVEEFTKTFREVVGKRADG